MSIALLNDFTDSTGGSATTTLSAAAGADSAAFNNNFASVAKQLNLMAEAIKVIAAHQMSNEGGD